MGGLSKGMEDYGEVSVTLSNAWDLEWRHDYKISAKQILDKITCLR
jgi:hypothetical protein